MPEEPQAAITRAQDLSQRARTLIDDGRASDVDRLITAAHMRSAAPDDVVIACLVGGTGSGKSSLVNAIAGMDLVEVGGVRPTTSSPKAVVAEATLDALDPYLEELELSSAVSDNIPDWLCLIDMPDTDSVIVDHRFEVIRLILHVDLMVWVVDPEKYRDRALHGDFIAKLAPQADRLGFVLNQVDRLSPEDLTLVLADFREALVEDGIQQVKIVATVAAPDAGPAEGVDELVGLLAEARGTAAMNIRSNLLRAMQLIADDLEAMLRTNEVDLAAGQAVAALDAGDTDGAVSCLTEAISELAERVPEPISGDMLRVAAELPVLLGNDPRSVPVRRRRWFRRTEEEVSTEPRPDSDAVIEARVTEPLSELLMPVAELREDVSGLIEDIETGGQGEPAPGR